MGVAGSGKSTIGPGLADRLGVDFVDGDAEHTEAAKARMAAGQPLDDAMRMPWLDRLHAILIGHAGRGLVLACSALKPAYRDRLREGVDLVFVALVAPEEVLADRLLRRTGHFAGPSLLPWQLAALDLGGDVVRVDAAQPVERVVAAAEQAVRRA